jgi:hypothetical protein
MVYPDETMLIPRPLTLGRARIGALDRPHLMLYWLSPIRLRALVALERRDQWGGTSKIDRGLTKRAGNAKSAMSFPKTRDQEMGPWKDRMLINKRRSRGGAMGISLVLSMRRWRRSCRPT